MGHNSIIFTDIEAQWSGHTLYVDVPNLEASAYRKRCVPISRIPNNSDVVRLYHMETSSDGSASEQTSITGHRGNDAQLHPSFQVSLQGLSPGTQSNLAGDVSTAQQQSREIYWCVDKVWTEPSETWLCILKKISDDRLLYKLLSDKLRKVQGLRSMFSWKSCTRVDFISVRADLPLASLRYFRPNIALEEFL